MVAVEKLAAWIELHRRVGDAKLRGLLNDGGAAKEILKSHGRPASINSMHRRLAASLIESGVSILTINSPEYPDCLRRQLQSDAPPILYVRGNRALFRQRSFAIIGTRRPSLEGRNAATSYSSAFAESGIVVVSGNAPGIDAAAHGAALAAGGATIVFPPTPMDQYVASFPESSDHQGILVASPFAPGIEVQPWCFLRRNTLVAAHCHAALIAETGTRGGTLDTLRKLRTMERRVWITQLPDRAKHCNAHRLIKSSGAEEVPLVASVEILAQLLREDPRPAQTTPRAVELQLPWSDAP